MNIFKIHPTKPYLATIAKFILENYSSLDDLTVLLPTRRACRFLQEALIELNRNHLILPKVEPIGDIDLLGVEDYRFIGKIEQKVLLTKIITEAPNFKFNYLESLSLSDSLLNLFNEFAIDDVESKKLEDLLKLDLPGHWQQIAGFLGYAYNSWKEALEKINKKDYVTFRNMLIYKKIEYFKENNLSKVIIAGAEGNLQAVKDLFKTIAEMPNSVSILPPIDLEIPSKTWENIEVNNACYLIKKLIDYCKTDYLEVKELNIVQDKRCSSARSSLMLNVVFKNSLKLPQEDLNVCYVEAHNIQQEAHIIALQIKYFLDNYSEYKAPSIGILTNDTDLVKMIEFQVEKFKLEIDNVHGEEIIKLEAFKFICFVIEAVIHNFQPINLLNLLKHPFLSSSLTSILEIKFYRKIETNKDFEHLIENTDGELKELLNNIYISTIDLKEIFTAEIIDFKSTLIIHIKTIETLYPLVWGSVESQELKKLFIELLDIADLVGMIPKESYIACLEKFFGGNKFRKKLGWRPLITAINPTEGRFLSFDFAILAELNEDSWPLKTKADPWMSNIMRKNIGLQDKDIANSESLYDFYLSMHNRKILITRSKRISGTEAISSRFLMRLINIIKFNQYNEFFDEGEKWHNLSDNLRYQISLEPVIHNFNIISKPKRFSPTSIEMLIRSPYAYYARYILKLKKLNKIAQEPTTAEFGSFLHNIFDEYCKKFLDAKDPESFILNLGKLFFEKNNYNEYIYNLWWPKFKAITKEFIVYDKGRRDKIHKIYTEFEGEYKIKEYIINAKVDRVEYDSFGNLYILDYKTGTIPTLKDVNRGVSPQLFLSSLVVPKEESRLLLKLAHDREFQGAYGTQKRNVFDIHENSRTGATQKLPAGVEFQKKSNIKIELKYIKVSSTSPRFKETLIKDIDFDKHMEGLLKLLKYYGKSDAVYPLHLSKAIKLKYNDYEHLGRQE